MAQLETLCATTPQPSLRLLSSLSPRCSARTEFQAISATRTCRSASFSSSRVRSTANMAPKQPSLCLLPRLSPRCCARSEFEIFPARKAIPMNRNRQSASFSSSRVCNMAVKPSLRLLPRLSPRCCARSEFEIIPARKAIPVNRNRRSPSFSASRVCNMAVKVFCDEVRGIVCYRNEFGEITCEGPDEGPHFHRPQTPEETSTMLLQKLSPFIGGQSGYVCLKEYISNLFSEAQDANLL